MTTVLVEKKFASNNVLVPFLNLILLQNVERTIALNPFQNLS